MQVSNLAPPDKRRFAQKFRKSSERLAKAQNQTEHTQVSRQLQHNNTQKMHFEKAGG